MERRTALRGARRPPPPAAARPAPPSASPPASSATGWCSRKTSSGTGGFSDHLTEDIELHMELLLTGERVSFAADAVLAAEMPATLGASRSQQERWERGRLEMARRYVPRLLRRPSVPRQGQRMAAARGGRRPARAPALDGGRCHGRRRHRVACAAPLRPLAPRSPQRGAQHRSAAGPGGPRPRRPPHGAGAAVGLQVSRVRPADGGLEAAAPRPGGDLRASGPVDPHGSQRRRPRRAGAAGLPARATGPAHRDGGRAGR